MTNIELILNQLAEVTTTDISRMENPTSFEESREIARSGGGVAATAREAYEKRMNRSVISPLNASDKPALEQSESTDNEE